MLGERKRMEKFRVRELDSIVDSLASEVMDIYYHSDVSDYSQSEMKDLFELRDVNAGVLDDLNEWLGR